MKHSITNEGLAVMIKDLAATVKDLANMVKAGFDETGHRLDILEQGQANIQARLDSEVYRHEFFALEKRVEFLELKVAEKAF
jgi:hypothetical protein